MKFKTSQFLIFILLTIFIYSCSNHKKAGKDNFVINGKLFNSKICTVTLEELTIKDRVKLDSVKIDEKGEFMFKHKLEQAGFYILKIDEKNFITLLLDRGETVNISADARQMAITYKLEGSKGSEKIHRINEKLRQNYVKVDSLRQVFEQSRYLDNFVEIKNNLDSAYNKVVLDEKKFVKSFIDSNLTSLASLIALYQTFGQEPVLSEKEDFIFFEKLSDNLIKKYPDNSHSKDLLVRVEDIKKNIEAKKKAQELLKKGNPAPEITLNNTSGEAVKLSSLRGKYVLLDFWASWCAPCRQLNPRLRKVYQKFKNKGFEIYAVSLDRDIQAWENAIKTDKIDWIQVSDLLYWQTPLVKLYDVESIPFNYLLDKEGKIFQKDIDVDGLETFLMTNIK